MKTYGQSHKQFISLQPYTEEFYPLSQKNIARRKTVLQNRTRVKTKFPQGYQTISITMSMMKPLKM